MIRGLALTAAACLLLSSCSPDKPETPPGGQADAPQAGDVADRPGESRTDEARDEDEPMTLYFYPGGPVAGEQRPSFEVSADDIEATAEREWTLKSAKAIIHRDEGPDVFIDAGSIWVDTEAERAVMEDSVVLEHGPLKVRLDELEYVEQERLITSEHPVVLERGDTRIAAQAMKYYPDEDRLMLDQGSGKVFKPAGETQ